MDLRRSILFSAAALLLAASLAPFGAAQASGSCGTQVVVQPGDTLSGIAQRCGTSVWAIQQANPGLGSTIYAGQVLYMPTGYYAGYYPYQPPPVGGTYVVQWGDTMGKIAARYSVWLYDLIAVNPQIWNPNLIYPGQVIYLPAYASAPVYPTQLPYYPTAQPYYPTPAPYYPTPTPYPCSYSCYPTPAYTPVPTATPPPLAPPIDYALWDELTVTYEFGLLVRTGPGREYPEIVSPLVSAVEDTEWWYRNASITTDASGFVWAEVYLVYMVNGRSTGWIMVADSIGGHFTEPEIDPPVTYAG